MPSREWWWHILNFGIGPKSSFVLASQLQYRARAAWPWKALEWRILISTKWIFFLSLLWAWQSIWTSYGSSEQNEETGGFLSKTTTSYVLLAKQRSVFIPGEKGHSILVAFLAGIWKGRKKVFLAPFRFLSNARYAGYRTRNIPHSIY